MKLSLISDTHGGLKWLDEVPPCDILVHAGDICPDSWKGIWCRKDLGRSTLWLKEMLIPKIEQLLDAGVIKHFVATLGNHDWVSRAEARKLSSEHIQFLVDRECESLGLTFWGSPWSNQFMDWAWMTEPTELAPYYAEIPSGVDVLITHQPPIGFGSQTYDITTHEEIDIGSYELSQELARINPKLVVCGHIHSGHGVYTHPLGFTVVNAAHLDETYRPTYPIETFTLRSKNDSPRS